jgi:predicted transcriptional regulator
MSRDFKVAIRGIDSYFAEAEKVLQAADNGKFPVKPVERMYFNDVKTFLRYITPKRFELLDRLHQSGAMSIRALTKVLGRHYKNVYDDVKMLEEIGLIEQTEEGLFCVPWNEIETTLKLAA